MMGIALRKSTASRDEENDALHRELAYFNRGRLSPGFAHPYWRSALQDELQLREREGYFVEAERQKVQPLLTDIPEQADAFVSWFEQLKHDGPGQGDPLFPWLANKATYEQMRWFLHQEVAGEAGFDDLVALTQVKMPVVAKLELARNYWDEMGRGNESGMHGPMLSRLAAAFGVAPTPETTVWEALALGNLMSTLAANRRYAYQSIGALGAIELTAPTRAGHVATALRRLGMDGKARVYFELHATLDVRHSEAWNREVIHSLVAENPDTALPIAEGAMLRLTAGARCFHRYRRELDGTSM
jgi:heme oxygenase-like protein